MKYKTVKVLDLKDKFVVNRLVFLGLRRIAAEVVVYLDQVDEADYPEIAVAIKRQHAQVSLALRELRRRGWIHETRDYYPEPFRARGGMHYNNSLTLTIPEIEEILIRIKNAPIIG